MYEKCISIIIYAFYIKHWRMAVITQGIFKFGAYLYKARNVSYVIYTTLFCLYLCLLEGHIGKRRHQVRLDI